VPGGQLGVAERGRELAQHRVQGLGERGDGGGDAAAHGLIGAADLDDARLGRAGAAVVVVVLALAELAAARAAADVAVGRIVAADLLAHDQAGAVDQREERLANGFAQQHVVDVVGRDRLAVRRLERLDDDAQTCPGGQAQAPGAELQAVGGGGLGHRGRGG
jgi:hypothetical protein